MASLFREGIHVDARRITKGTVAWDELPPGDYAVCVIRGGARPLRAWRSSRHSRVGSPSWPSPCPAGPVILRATDSAGRNVLIDWISIEPDGAPAPVVLPAGVLELDVASEDGYRGRVSVTAAGTEPIVVTLAQKK